MPSAPTDGSDTAELAALSDDALVERARERDLGAFEILVDRHQERLYRVAMRLLRNETDAQEVLQDALVSTWQNLDSYAGRAQFGSWLHRVVVNAALMLLRSRRRRPTVSIDDMTSEARDETLGRAQAAGGFATDHNWAKRPDDQLQSNEFRQFLQEAIADLPETLRVTFLLRDVEGLSTEQTAEVLEINVPAVKTRLHRARLALRRAISSYFERA